MKKGYILLFAGCIAMVLSTVALAASETAEKREAQKSEKKGDAAFKADKQQAEADYKKALAACEKKDGKAQAACKKEAKGKYDKARYDAKGTHAEREAKADAAKQRAKTTD